MLTTYILWSGWGDHAGLAPMAAPWMNEYIIIQHTNNIYIYIYCMNEY